MPRLSGGGPIARGLSLPGVRARQGMGTRHQAIHQGLRRQTSVTAGNMIHGSKLALTIWFWAAYQMATYSNGISARQLRGQLGLGSYKTTWLLSAKLRLAMVASDVVQDPHVIGPMAAQVALPWVHRLFSKPTSTNSSSAPTAAEPDMPPSDPCLASLPPAPQSHARC